MASCYLYLQLLDSWHLLNLTMRQWSATGKCSASTQAPQGRLGKMWTHHWIGQGPWWQGMCKRTRYALCSSSWSLLVRPAFRGHSVILWLFDSKFKYVFLLFLLLWKWAASLDGDCISLSFLPAFLPFFLSFSPSLLPSLSTCPPTFLSAFLPSFLFFSTFTK